MGNDSMIKGPIRAWLNKANNNSRVPQLIFGILVFALGITVRVNFVAGSNYPLNDGGFFYRMTEELINNNFLLPKYSQYNHSGIPFAYPPFAFYLMGITRKIFGVSLLALFKYFPLIISCLSIPIFYLLTTKFFKEGVYRLLALYLFVTLPRSFEWFVMGGGSTRSLGFFFAMLSVYFLWGAFEDNKYSSKLIWGSLFSALTILSHPLSSLFLAFSVIVIFFYHYPVNIKLVLLYGVLILITTSPWWITVLNYHGFSPFIGASNTGHLNWFEIKNVVTQNYGYENPYFLSIVSMLAIFGLFSKHKRLPITLSILCVVGYLVIPRGGTDYLTAYLPMLAAIGFQVITDPWNKESAVTEGGNQYPFELKSKRTRALLIFVFLYVFIGAFSYKYVYNKTNLRVDQNNFQAMEWLRENTSEAATVLIIPVNEENRYWWNDFISEWLPAISERESITTVQGYEWKPEKFEERISKYWSLRNCSKDYRCISDWQDNNGFYASYIYLDDLLEQNNLSLEILESGSFSIVFQNENVMILEDLNR